MDPEPGDLEWGSAAPARRPWGLVAGALVVVGVVGWLAGADLRGGAQLQVRTQVLPTAAPSAAELVGAEADGTRPGAGGWLQLTSPELAGRGDHSATWTGDELLVFGGRPDPGVHRLISLRVESDGVTIEVLPPGPLGGRAEHTAVWTGTELVVLGGARTRPSYASSYQPAPAESDVAAYNPATRTWRALPVPPIALALKRVAVWTGRQVVAIGQASSGGLPAAAALDLASGTWTTLPEPPIGLYPAPVGVWTGAPGAAADEAGTGVVLVWGGQRGGPAAAYDPQAGTWRELAPAPDDLRPFNYPVALWAGGRMLVIGRPFGSTAPTALSVTANGTWGRLPRSPLTWATRYQAAWTGDAIYLVGGREDLPGAQFDAFGIWRDLAPGPVGPITGHTSTWTGSQLLLVGGMTLDGEKPAGAVFTPR